MEHLLVMMKLNFIKEKISQLFRYKRHKALSLILTVLCSFLLAVLLERAIKYGLRTFMSMIFSLPGDQSKLTIVMDFSMMSVYRIVLLFCIFFFILVHFIVKIKVFYDIIFRYRYLLAVVVLLLLVANKINFSSVGMYDHYVQPDHGTEFTEPIFGWARAIRSDEWLVTTPIQLSAQYDPDPYGRLNYIARGTATENMPNGMAINLATLAFPMNIFYLFGVEYGVSARWVGILIMTFMVTFEFAYIISGKNRLLGVAGACLITFSPFFQWWSYVYFITAGIGTLVCLYYFLYSETRLKKALFALGIVVFFSQFIVTLYPAWQVPAGYLYLGLGVWIITDNRDRIKKLDKIDYGIIAAALLLTVAIVGTYFYGSREYISGISNTVYPGTRHISGGGGDSVWLLGRMMNGGVLAPVSVFSGFNETNICEVGGFYTLFPIPLLFASFIMIRKRLFDLLSIILIVFTLFIGSYIFIGWPDWLARITLLSQTAPERAVDVMLFAQVFLLIRVMSRFAEAPGRKTNLTEAGILTGSVAAGLCLTFIMWNFSRTALFSQPGLIYFAFAFIGFTAVVYCIFDRQRKEIIFKIACLYIVVLSIATWVTVHPIMKGLDAIYSKPLSAAIKENADDPDEKWISLSGIYGPSYLIANGASTINSTNFYPNLDLWYKLDPDRKYEYAYNRYAVITVELTSEETSFELLNIDHLHIYFSVNDLEKADVKYIHTSYPLEDLFDIDLTLLYNEDDERIYSVN